MTLQEIKAMNLALEALMYASYEDIEYNDACAAKVLEARNALKEALAQPEQEPLIGCVNHDCAKCKERIWVGLTDEEQQQAYEQWQNDGWGVFYNAIEAKLKERNS